MKLSTVVIIAILLCGISLVLFGEPLDLSGSRKEFSFMEFTNDQGKNIGRLSWENGSMKFSGSEDDSAKFFFEVYVKPIVDEYMKNQCEPKS